MSSQIIKNQYFSNSLIESIFWKLLSCFCFAGINGIVRYLTKFQGIGVYNTYFYQYFFACILIIVIKPKFSFKDFKTNYPILHLNRIIFSVLGTGFLYSAFKYIPIAQALALTFLGPILTIIGAVILLRETLTVYKIAAIVSCTFAAYLITKPDNQAIEGIVVNCKLALPFLATSCLVIAKLLTSKLARSGESPKLLTYYLIFFSCPLTFCFALNDWQFLAINNLVWIISLSILTIVAFYAFNRAYALADVTFLMPFGATKFISSIFIGYIAFAEYPQTVSTWLGIVIISLSITLLGYKNT